MISGITLVTFNCILFVFPTDVALAICHVMWTECRGIPLATTTTERVEEGYWMDSLYQPAIVVKLRGNESFAHYVSIPISLKCSLCLRRGKTDTTRLLLQGST